MALEDKILNALSRRIVVERFGWEKDGGISGFIVSPTFQNMTSLARQQLIDEALNTGPDTLSAEERRHVYLIAALTPVEFQYVGSRIRIQRVREQAENTVEILLDGGLADAEYVREKLNDHKGIRTTKPRAVRVPGVSGTCTAFRAKGTEAAPLTKAKALRVLKKDPYIDVVANA